MDRAARIVAGEIENMTPEDIIRMAREAGMTTMAHDSRIERFAALVAAAEREACAMIAREFDRDHPNTNYGGYIARLIEGDK